MKTLVSIALLVSMFCTLFVAADASARRFSWLGPRDAARLDMHFPAPCIFPPIENLCAVPCRPPGLQGQAAPCAFKTACPSKKLPCHGVSYGSNPYPLFQ